MRALLVDPAERWAHVGALGAQVETIARGHLASADEIAALVAGFAAGMGRSSITSISDVETIPPPPPPAAAAVTSLAPTSSSIETAPDDPESVAPVEVPALERSPVAQRWEAPPPSAPRIWLPTDQDAFPVSAAQGPASSDVADSWSGVAPYSVPGMSRRSKTIVWAMVSASLALAGIAVYQLLDRSPETRATATVLAPKMTPGRSASAAPLAAAAPKPALEPATASTTGIAAAPDNSATGESMHKVDERSPASLSASTSVGGLAPSAAGVAPPTLNRPAPRPVVRPAPPPPVNAVPRPAAPSPAPAPAKPKPKEDMFGI
jgi:hypothetical protein